MRYHREAICDHRAPESVAAQSNIIYACLAWYYFGLRELGSGLASHPPRWDLVTILKIVNVSVI